MRTRLAVLSSLLALTPSPTGAQPVPPPGVSPPFRAPSAPGPGTVVPSALAAVPTDVVMFATVNVGKLWENPGVKPLRAWFEAQKSGPIEGMVGVPAAEVERVTVFVPAATRDAVPVVLVTTKKPYSEARVLKALGVGGDRLARAGAAVALGGGRFAAVVFGDERTLVFLPEPRESLGLAAVLGQVLAKKPDGPLAAALADATRHDVAVAVDARALVATLNVEREKELTPYLALLKARTVTFAADFGATATGALKLNFADEAAAKRAAPVLQEAFAEGLRVLDKEFPAGKDAEPAARALVELVGAVLKGAKVEAAGTAVVATATVPHDAAVAKLAAALPKEYAERVNSVRGQNNLKQLALGFHNFESAYGVFPSDVSPFGGPNPPAMSWRVQILPFLEQDNLFRQLDMTKGWDHPDNLNKLEAMEMPKVFEIPGRPAPKGHTYFRVFSLPKGAKGFERPFFVEGQKGGTLAGISDGTSNTFMIVEAGEAVPWYKPDLLPYDGKLPLPQLGDKDADRFIVAFGDGSVRVLRPSKLGEKTLRALITTSGGEVVTLP